MLNDLLKRVISIQNTQHNLRWGYDTDSEKGCTVICVYHTVYKQVRFFYLTNDCTMLYDLSVDLPTRKKLLWSSDNAEPQSLINAVQVQLKKWFPSKRRS